MKTKLISFVLITGLALSANAQILISGIFDGDSSDPKGIEVFVVSSGDYTDWEVETQSNANTTWSTGYTFSGSYTAGDYLYLTSTSATLTSWGWDTSKGTIVSDGSFNQNGDDTFRVIDDSSTIIDLFGVDGTDGTGQAWEYTDSYAYRNDNVAATATFSSSNWTFGGVNFLETVSGGQQAFLTDTFGTFAVPEPSAYAMLAGLSALGFVMMRRRRA